MVKEQILKSGKTVQQIADEIGVSRQAVYGWIAGAMPEGENREKLEKIIGKIEDKDREKKIVVDCMDKMNEMQKAKIVSLAAGMTGTDVSQY